MQKKLLTVAIGAALAAPAMMVQADVTVYGIAQVEWAQVKNDSLYYTYPYGSASTFNLGSWNNTNTVPINTTRSGTVDNKSGRFGIKASEDLGNGWKGIAQFEWQVDTADGVDGNVDSGGKGSAATTITDRVSIVGISQKSIGTLSLGQNNGPYKTYGVALDPFVATTLEARNNYGMSGNADSWGVMNGHGSWLQDSLFFDSANWAGVSVNLAIGLDRTGSDGACESGLQCSSAGNNNGKNNGDLGIGVRWDGDVGPVGLKVFGAYNKMANVNTTSGQEPTAMKIGTQVIVAKAHTVSLQYEMTNRDDLTATDIDEATYIFIGYQGKFGPVTAVAQLGKFETGSTGATSYEGNYLAIGAIYNMSKTFRVFGGWRNTVLSTSAGIGADIRDDTVLSVGMRKDF